MALRSSNCVSHSMFDLAMMDVVCSFQGTTIIPEVVRVTRKLLETHLRLQIYREFGDWIHLLYNAHVQPTLAAHYKNTKGSMGYADRLVAAACCTRLSQEAT